MAIMKERSENVDLLRAIGILFIILAHVNPPFILKQIRSFDVCLLVFLSGYCCSYKDNYKQYINKRVKRLCFPAWITATIIFLSCAILCLIDKQNYLYSFRQIIETYLFIGGIEGGIGLFWIVRIYLIVTLLTPVLIEVEKKTPGLLLWVLLGLVLLINEIIFRLIWDKSVFFNFLLENFVMSGLAYSCVFLLGIREKDKNQKDNWGRVFGLCLFLLCGITIASRVHSFPFPNNYKYPPRMFYTLYGMLISVLLFKATKGIQLGRIKNTIEWVSKNSYTLYFCHAFVLKVISWGDRFIRTIPLLKHWIVSYLIVLCSSVCLTITINWINKNRSA